MNLTLKHLRNAIQLAAAAVAVAAVPLRAADSNPPKPADDQVVRLDEIEVRDTRDTTALTMAPIDSPLTVRQPQSTINIDFIANNIAPTADFATIANLAPSVSNVETNGPGLSESKHLTIRGFDDAQYNVTFDGIPFGDINDFSHHTTSYFPAKLIGKVVVERGPGRASDIGYATFGGTLALFSKDPRKDAVFVPTVSLGSWDTRLYHFEVDSGLLSGLGGASAIGSFQRMSTSGYRTHADMSRNTYYVKYLQPIGQGTTLTFLSSYNTIRFNNPGTVTQAQIDTLGRNYGLGGDPTKTDYAGYNYQEKQADFEYLGLDCHLGDGWSMSDKFYTYYYNNESHEKPKTKTVSGVVNILGRFKVNRFRTWGNYFNFDKATDLGNFRAGLWIDFSRNPRYLNSLNYTTLGWNTLDTTGTTQWKAVNGDPSTVGVDYNMVDYLRTLQPFAEFEWRPTSNLTIEPGVKYVSFTRVLEAPVNGTSARLPLYYQQTWTKTLPYLSGNYRIDNSWSAYAQIAEGFLGPNLHDFYVTDPTQSNIKPEQTMNYQVGTVYKTDRFNADFDAYYIDFSNYSYSGPTDPSTGDPLYYGTARGAHFSGVEAELTYSFGGGVSAYANGSIAKATFKGSGLDVPTVPKETAAVGLLYEGAGFFGSFTEKYVGSWVAYDNLTNPDVAGGGVARRADSDSYWIGDLSVGYSMKLHNNFFRSFKVRFQVGNLFNNKVQVLEGIDSNPANAYAKDTFNVLPERNYFLTLSAEF